MNLMSMHFTQRRSPRQRIRICMNFMFRNGWHISFLEADCRTSLPLKLTFADADKIREIRALPLARSHALHMCLVATKS